MPDDTPNLALPYILPGQAQKHVTHNEALGLLDAMVQLSVLDRTRTAPPATPADGDRHLVAVGATGAWDGWEDSIAFRIDDAWLRLIPRPGWQTWVEAEAVPLIRTASAWLGLDAAMGLITQSASVIVARGAHDGTLGMAVFEDTLSGLSGTDTPSSIMIPAGTLLLGVSTRTLTAITGATSFDCGVAGNPDKFGAALGIITYLTGNAVYAKYLFIPYIPGAGELTVFCGALAGAGLGFLWFNAYPAEVFMGDVGALALGAALGAVAVVARLEILLFIMGGVFVAETVSVMIQVGWFKYTKRRYGQGRRILLMAPLHHHFEQSGWKETQVVVRFWIITILLVLFGLSTLKLR